MGKLENRKLRERIYKASTSRNNDNSPYDNKIIILKLAHVRAKIAQLKGYPNWASYVISNQMAKTPEKALKLLTDMIAPVNTKVKQESAKLLRSTEKSA